MRITGDIVGRGFAVEIEDRGLGITEERLAEINANLADPPAFDLSGSDRLGLFIAGQLARRHDITITLRPSAYGGTTAIVIIPLKLLVVDEDGYERVPAIGADGARPAAGRPARWPGPTPGRERRCPAGHRRPAGLPRPADRRGRLAAAERDLPWPGGPAQRAPR